VRAELLVGLDRDVREPERPGRRRHRRKQLGGRRDRDGLRVEVVGAEVPRRTMDRRIRVAERVAPVAAPRIGPEWEHVPAGDDEAAHAIPGGDEHDQRVVLVRDLAAEVHVVRERERAAPASVHHLDPHTRLERREALDHEVGGPAAAERERREDRALTRSQRGEAGTIEVEFLYATDADQRRRPAA